MDDHGAVVDGEVGHGEHGLDFHRIVEQFLGGGHAQAAAVHGQVRTGMEQRGAEGAFDIDGTAVEDHAARTGGHGHEQGVLDVEDGAVGSAGTSEDDVAVAGIEGQAGAQDPAVTGNVVLGPFLGAHEVELAIVDGDAAGGREGGVRFRHVERTAVDGDVFTGEVLFVGTGKRERAAVDGKILARGDVQADDAGGRIGLAGGGQGRHIVRALCLGGLVRDEAAG